MASTVSASWLLPVSGSWITPTNWSSNPFYPNNNTPTGTTYDVTLGATGASHTVDLFSGNDVTIDRLTLASPDVTFRCTQQTGNGLTVTNGIDVQAGTLNFATFFSTYTGGDINVAAGARFIWGSGTIQGAGVTRIAPGATASITGHVSVARPFVNEGTLNGGNNSFGIYSSTFTNAAGAVASFETASTPLGTPVSDYAATVVNRGTMTFNSGGTFGSTSTLRRQIFINSGTIHLDVGTLNFDWSDWRFEDGSTLTGNGHFDFGIRNKLVTGTLTLAGKHVHMGGSLVGDGTILVTPGATLHWGEGGMSGTGRTIIQHGAVVDTQSDPFAPTMNIGRRVINSGTMILDASSISFSNGTLQNQSDGVITLSSIAMGQANPARGWIENDGTMQLVLRGLDSGLSARASIRNTGTFIVNAGTTMSMEATIPAVEFRNTGTFINNGYATFGLLAGSVSAGNVDGNGTLTIVAADSFTNRGFNASRIRQRGLVVQNGASVALDPNGADDAFSRVESLTMQFGNGANFDLYDNDLIYDGTFDSSPFTIYANLFFARNGGAWTGKGLNSTAARLDPTHSTALGFVGGSEFKSVYGPSATFDGQTFGNLATLVRYTYYGDTDLNGVVNFDDYARIDSGFNNAGTGGIVDWFHGDFNYDLRINFDDYALIDHAFNTQGAPLTTPVPEPGTALTLTFATALGARRRRR